MMDSAAIFLASITAVGALVSAIAAVSEMSATRRQRKSAESWDALERGARSQQDREVFESLHRSATARLVSYDAVPASWIFMLSVLSLGAMVRLNYMAVDAGHLWRDGHSAVLIYEGPWALPVTMALSFVGPVLSSVFFVLPASICAHLLCFRWQVERNFLATRDLRSYEEDAELSRFKESGWSALILLALAYVVELELANAVSNPLFPTDAVGTGLYVVGAAFVPYAAIYVLVFVRYVRACGSVFDTKLWWDHPAPREEPGLDDE